jgi:SAM-dependent methyltransferase
MMLMNDAERIRKYWEDRASSDKSAQSTTLDFYLREIEFRCVTDVIAKYRPSRVFDIGCGDAYTTTRLAAKFANIAFVGGDYAQAMTDNARRNVQQLDLKNVEIVSYDVCKPTDLAAFDLVYTNRCLINLDGWESQKQGLANVARALKPSGVYVMIENFLDGHREMNTLRQSFGLPEIKIRDHNCFFDAETALPFLNTLFVIEDSQNISSAYYLVTRVIYSKICQDKGTAPDYFDEHHKLAAQLPFFGNCGPVKMLTLKGR